MPHASANPPADHPLLVDLTEPQRLAVTTTEGPLLVMAAAGSGKTRVITRRIVYIVKQLGIAPWQVCAITFTNKAAAEMRQRVAQLVSEKQARALTVCTFHSLCARLLRQYADRAGLTATFSIYDTADQKRAIKEAMKGEEINEKNFTPDALLSAISAAKNNLVDVETFTSQSRDFFSRIVAKAYRGYEKVLRTNNALDFDDLLMRTANLLRSDEQTRLELEDRFQYLMIDEYQDTNHVQFVLAHLLAARHRNLCVVGDPDQSIYGWRGANIRNILEFEQHFPNAQVIALGQNYRSTPEILKLADTLIRNNVQRRHKDLFTQNPAGEKIRLVQTADEEHEAKFVLDWFKQLHDAGSPWSDMVVFYRMNALSRVMEDILWREGVPYQIARGTAFYQRQEIKDAIAYLRSLNNPDDAVSLERIINTPPRAIGNTTIEHLQAFASAKGLSFWQAVQNAGSVPTINNRAITAVGKFAAMMNKWRGKLETAEQEIAFVPGVRDLVEMVIRESGLEKHYHEDEEKAGNLDELISAAQRFDEQYENDQATLAQKLLDYLEQVALVSDTDAVKDNGGAVTLMTLHAAKGLEFPNVAMIGLEEGLLPHSRSVDNADQLEEERRLCFVGITRAEKRLLLTYARYRTIRGMRERSIPSQFIRELPRDVMEEEDLSGEGFGTWGSPRPDDLSRPASRGGLLPGVMVEHPQFGVGTVVAVNGAGASARIKVQFTRFGVKTLIQEYARLEILD
ncbi:MAG: UvrD-helicase domain-containing protein [Phycisphaeraceae bacterium]